MTCHPSTHFEKSRNDCVNSASSALRGEPVSYNFTSVSAYVAHRIPSRMVYLASLACTDGTPHRPHQPTFHSRVQRFATNRSGKISTRFFPSASLGKPNKVLCTVRINGLVKMTSLASKSFGYAIGIERACCCPRAVRCGSGIDQSQATLLQARQFSASWRKTLSLATDAIAD